MKYKLILSLGGVMLLLVAVVCFGLPAFAQSHFASQISGTPLSMIAAREIINDSGLPIERLGDGTTNSITRGRDAVNAYRYAHTLLGKDGWYRGISEDHTPLLKAMVQALEKEGFTSSYLSFSLKKDEVIQKFWDASDMQNVLEGVYETGWR